MNLNGKVALVTGAGTGLGREVALLLGAEGAAVGVNFASSEKEANATAAEIEAAGGRALPVKGDVSQPDDVRGMFGTVAAELGEVDVLVNNAGVTEHIPFSALERVSVETWRRILDVNVIGAFLCAQSAAPGMIERGSGKIVNVTTGSVYTLIGCSIPYVASKAALTSLTHCLARALAPTVQVNAVAPGWMETPWMKKYWPPEAIAEAEAAGEVSVPVEDVARGVLRTIENDSVTGQVMVVDAGELVALRAVT